MDLGKLVTNVEELGTTQGNVRPKAKVKERMEVKEKESTAKVGLKARAKATIKATKVKRKGKDFKTKEQAKEKARHMEGAIIVETLISAGTVRKVLQSTEQ